MTSREQPLQSGGVIERALARDRTLIMLALTILTLLAWLDVWQIAVAMDANSGAAAAGMHSMAMPAFRHWSTVDFVFTFSMWTVMMVAMMLPSVSPVLLLRARVARQARAQGQPYAGAGVFLAGYLLVWSFFSALATTAQLLLDRAALLTPMIATRSNALGGAVLIAAGVYQWTPIKAACLEQCQSPLGFLSRFGGLEGGTRAALVAGVRHGVYCLGCCWALMALVFVGGVMNLLWIAAIAVVVLLEKVVAKGPWLSRAAGGASIAAGLWLMST